ncbi:MAG: hypothetical protein ACRCT8_08170 [Lacipirellulaceae bacterium]
MTRHNLFGLAFSAAFALPLAVKAGSLQFAFVARVTSVSDGAGAAGFPISFRVGDELACSLEFPSRDVLQELFDGPSAFSSGLMDMTAQGEVLRHRFNLAGGAVNDPSEPLPVESPGVSLTYWSFTDVYPGWGGNAAGVWWDALLALVGTPGTPFDRDDMISWNDLTTRRRLYLRIGAFETVEVVAEIGEITAVPEPTGLCAAVAASGFGGAAIARRRFRCAGRLVARSRILA